LLVHDIDREKTARYFHKIKLIDTLWPKATGTNSIDFLTMATTERFDSWTGYLIECLVKTIDSHGIKQMCVCERLEDARFLFSAGGQQGVFVAVFIAAAATSRKRYSKEQ
jgi:hypothetical protein